MNISEFIVIYLSLGAAFGVYGFFNADLKYPRNIGFGLAVFVFWPAFIFRFSAAYLFRLLSIVFEQPAKSDSHTGNELQILQKKLENSHLYSNNDLPLYVWRDTIARYCGLSLASAHNTPDTKNPLFEHSGRKPLQIQNLCLQRRNARKLSVHQNAVRDEFVKSVAAVANSNNDVTVFSAAKRFAGALKDEVTVVELSSHEAAFSIKPEHGRTTTVENIWAHQSN